MNSPNQTQIYSVQCCIERTTVNMDEWMPHFVDTYDPLMAGSIDGTDTVPHDKGIYRAMQAKYKPNLSITGEPKCTVFVARLNPHTNEQTIQERFNRYGSVKKVSLIRDIITGFSKCYGFVEYHNANDAKDAALGMHQEDIDDFHICVEMEKERMLTGWIPRRLGGGIGGKKESGQIRFGGVDRPFHRVIQVKKMNHRFHRSPSRDRQTSKSRESTQSYKRDQYKTSYRNRRLSRSRSRGRSRSRERRSDQQRVGFK